MKKRRIDIQMEQAMNDKDICSIMHKACDKFVNQLDSDEIHTCKMNALWKSFVNFNPDKGCKFTTYLYKGVFIECLKAVKFINKSRNFRPLNDSIPASTSADSTIMEILDEANNDYDKELLLDKASKMTNKELSEKYGIGKETMRKKMKKITNKFRHKFR